LALDGGNEGRTLKEGARERFDGAVQFEGFYQGLVETNDSDVFLSRRLLGFDETRGAIQADDETSRDFGIERPGMSRLFHSQYPFDPRDDFVRRRIGGFVQINDSVGKVCGERTSQWRRSRWKWSVMGCSNV
jgi:hypothetical protein